MHASLKVVPLKHRSVKCERLLSPIDVQVHIFTNGRQYFSIASSQNKVYAIVFKLICVKNWKEISIQKKYFDDLAKRLNIKSSNDWYSITNIAVDPSLLYFYNAHYLGKRA